MSDLNWHDRLNHIRYSRFVLFMEKWATVLCILVLLSAGYNKIAGTFLAVFLFFTWFAAHQNHYGIEEAGGLPVNHFSVRY